MKRNLVYGLTVFLLTIFLASCCGGGKKETVVVPSEGTVKETVIVKPESSATTGKQLQDLKEAHDKGAITDEEFEKAKEKILTAE